MGPSTLALIYASLTAGCAFQRAVVRPLLKKTNPDFTELFNFRPDSNLSFTSKAPVNFVFTQPQVFLECKSVLEKFKSGFRSRQSTESALLKVHNDIVTVDARRPVLLVLLDLDLDF